MLEGVGEAMKIQDEHSTERKQPLQRLRGLWQIENSRGVAGAKWRKGTGRRGMKKDWA